MKMIVLKSSDGEIFEVEEAVAMESQMLKHMIEDNCADAPIPLSNVTSEILAMVIQYCKHHLNASKASDVELKRFDADFMKVDQDTLLGLIMAANYLDIKSLYDLTCKTAADMIRGKTTEEIRETFNIRNDFEDP